MHPTTLLHAAALAALLAPAAAQSPVFQSSVFQSPAPRSPGLQPLKSPDSAPSEVDAPLSIRESMTGPLVTRPGDGRVWVRTRDFRASFGRDAFDVLPVFGKEAPHEFPVHFTVDAATVAGEPLDVTALADPTAVGETVEVVRGGLREVYHLAVDRVEQTFVFDALPPGELVLRLGVETELEAREVGDELRFAHPTFGEVTYGAAFVVDAAGATRPLPRTFDGRSITFTVPAAFLAEAALPVTIDPVITTFVNSYGVADDLHPDVCYAGGVSKYFVCWQEYTSSVNADVYVTSFTHTGVQGTSFAVDNSSDYWATPRLAYVPAANRVLVVASRSPSGPASFHGTGGVVMGQLVDAASSSIVGPPFSVSSSGSYKSDPDVGGTNYVSATSNHFLVAWSRHVNGATRFVEYRVMDWDGSPVTNVVTVAGTVGERAVQPAVSESHGDATLSGDEWTLVWIRDSDLDFRGQVWARRVAWNGNPALGNGNFLVDASTYNQNPTVTSRFDVPVLGDRPSIVAWDYQSPIFPVGSSPQPDVRARVVIDGQAFARNDISATLEDYDAALRQFEPSIGTDGNGFVLTYHETWYADPTGGDHDVLMLSGHITVRGNDVVLALSERHQLFGSSFSPEVQCRVAMIQDGDNQSTADQGMCVYTRVAGPNGGRIHGAILDSNTFAGSSEVAVGVQYCEAEPNSFGQQYDGRTGSWLWVRGDRSVASTHRAICVDMPQDAFGYLACSQTPGDVLHPGGSQGRLCLGGQIGRFVQSIQSSGTNRTISTPFQPLALPQPSGFVAAMPGQTWNFQVWHRDAVGGVPTSNFSNACSVTFRP